MPDQSGLQLAHRSAADEPSSAARLATLQFQGNIAPLTISQPAVAELLGGAELPALNWLFGRDGALTARTSLDCRWWGGSSLPLVVGRSLMKSLEVAGSLGIFISPGTAGQIRAALEKVAPNQAIVAAIPDAAAALVALHCDDFRASIASGRLWLVCGQSWARQLADLLQSHPGLCVPQQYIRTGLLADADATAMMNAGNPILSDETNRRAGALADIQRRWATKPPAGAINRVCVVAGSNFTLWDLAGPVLADVLRGPDLLRDPSALWTRLDKDHPASASPLALAEAAANGDAIVASDLFRADLPGVVPDEMPWLTWVTQPRVPAPQILSQHDSLLLADPSWQSLASRAGWSTHRMHIAGWPALDEPSPIPTNGPLVLMADAELEPAPDRLRDFSSHAVLWDQISQELTQDPMALGAGLQSESSAVDAYLFSRMAQLDIEHQAINQDLFRQKLILPAWRRGIARILAKAGLPLVVFGAGWDQTDEFASNFGGFIRSIHDLRRVARLASAIVYPSPQIHNDPVYALGRPVLRPAGNLVRQAATLLKSPSPAPTPTSPISPAAILAGLKF